MAGSHQIKNVTGIFKKRKNPLYILTSIILIISIAVFTGSVALVVALILIVLVLFYPVFLFFWEKLYGLEDIADQVFHAHTEDGWNIAMHFHRPAYPRAGAYPVILSHGIAVNKYGVDLDRGHSLAYFLKQNGYPVFVLSLRGVGKSYHSSKPGYKDYCFDDIVNFDVPAVIQKVRELTGAPKVNWVGHSMGSMIAYGFLGRKLPGHEHINTLVAIGAPGSVDHAQAGIWGAVARVPWVNNLLDLKFGAQVVSPLSGRFTLPIEELVYNKEIVGSTTIRRIMKNAVENIAPGLAKQLVDWVNSSHMLTKDGSFDYQDGLKNITLPALFMAGSRDFIAAPEAVRYAYENVSSKIKDYRLLGQSQGYPADYCHTGLVLGDRAILDVYPQVQVWLDEHGGEYKKISLLQKVVSRLKRRGGNRNSETKKRLQPEIIS